MVSNALFFLFAFFFLWSLSFSFYKYSYGLRFTNTKQFRKNTNTLKLLGFIRLFSNNLKYTFFFFFFFFEEGGGGGGVGWNNVCIKQSNVWYIKNTVPCTRDQHRCTIYLIHITYITFWCLLFLQNSQLNLR